MGDRYAQVWLGTGTPWWNLPWISLTGLRTRVSGIGQSPPAWNFLRGEPSRGGLPLSSLPGTHHRLPIEGRLATLQFYASTLKWRCSGPERCNDLLRIPRGLAHTESTAQGSWLHPRDTTFSLYRTEDTVCPARWSKGFLQPSEEG